MRIILFLDLIFMFKTKIMRPWKQKLHVECSNMISNTLVKYFWKIFCLLLVLFIACMQVDFDGCVLFGSHQARKQWCTKKSNRRQEESCPGQECQSPGPREGSSWSTAREEKFSAKGVTMTDKTQVNHIISYKGFQQQATKNCKGIQELRSTTGTCFRTGSLSSSEKWFDEC